MADQRSHERQRPQRRRRSEEQSHFRAAALGRSQLRNPRRRWLRRRLCSAVVDDRKVISNARPEFTCVDSGFRFLAGAAKLADQRLLITHYLPLTVTIGPKFANE